MLCDMLWPIVDLDGTEDHVGDPSLESKLLSAVTGMDIDEEGLNRIGERVFNLQRAILVREGHRGRGLRPAARPLLHRSATVRSGESGLHRSWQELGAGQPQRSHPRSGLLREDEGRILPARGWDMRTGLQTRALLEGLDLRDMADDLGTRGAGSLPDTPQTRRTWLREGASLDSRLRGNDRIGGVG